MLGAVAAWQMNGNELARSRALYLDGTDVLLAPGSGGNRVGVPIDTCEVIEQGPGGVSSMRFDIEDPEGLVMLQEGQEIRFHDIVNDRPIFLGWLQSWDERPFGLGRVWIVTAVGVEAVLDWIIVTSYTIPGSQSSSRTIWGLLAAATSVGVPLRVVAKAGGAVNDADGDADAGVGTLFPGGSAINQPGTPLTVAGVTLREAIRQALDAAIDSDLTPITPADGVFTVDFYGQLRLWRRTSTPADYDTLTVTDTGASSIVAENISHTVDPGGIVRGVYIVGGAAAGTGVVMDGTGIPGPIATFSDANVLDADGLFVAGTNYLQAHGAITRGSFDLFDRDITDNIRAGSLLVLDDDMLDLHGTYQIGQMQRRFTGKRTDWSFTYGGLPPSATTLMRRLTRSVLS